MKGPRETEETGAAIVRAQPGNRDVSCRVVATRRLRPIAGPVGAATLADTAPTTDDPHVTDAPALDSRPDDLPVPTDDGACDHLEGTRLPPVALGATDGRTVELAALAGRTVVYVYPRTGVPGTPLPDGWDAIPGARGCTPQSCSFRDHHAELLEAGADAVFGLSTQTSDYQGEAAERLALPFALLSDASLAFCRALSLPTFEADGRTLARRVTLVIDDGVVTKAFYPVFPPERSAADTLAWLRGEGAGG